MVSHHERSNKPWPRRAVITAGMPYGNKPLHFGHIGGVFVPADVFARFLRDRIGAENVRFVCGTDCFGSPIEEGYSKLLASGEFSGSITDYVRRNHDDQKATLDSYDISLSLYEGSGLGSSAEMHQRVSDTFITQLYENGFLKLCETMQFFDTSAQTFLNGRQVKGHCPVQGCRSDHAYADECDLGHQYAPEDLISPVSTLSGSVPKMRPVQNWYFDLPAFASFLQNYVTALEADETIRPVVSQTIKEFLAPPIIYIKNELMDAYRSIADDLPEHVMRPAEKGKQSFEIEFSTSQERDAARPLLAQANIRYRTGKALVPFRMTGNIAWGVKAPVLDGIEGLSVYCWPESLWAPISFTMAYAQRIGHAASEWRDFWCSDDAQVYQFIGQDNLYFYGVAQTALWEALGPCDLSGEGKTPSSPLSQTKLIANHHLLLGKKKVSSSSAIKPPTADELLDYYTVEQLRAHFLALGLDQKSVSFKPKPFDPDITEDQRSDPRVADPVLKEGTLLTNVFNRLARSCFYEAQKNFASQMPLGNPSPDVAGEARKVIDTYDSLMHKVELHSIMSLMDEFIRFSNKCWTDGIGSAQKSEDETMRRQVLTDSFYLLRICTLLMHPVVPRGCELICNHMNFDMRNFFSWNWDFKALDELCSAEEQTLGFHRIQEIPPRFDFFRKHQTQYR